MTAIAFKTCVTGLQTPSRFELDSAHELKKKIEGINPNIHTLLDSFFTIYINWINDVNEGKEIPTDLIIDREKALRELVHSVKKIK